MRLVKNLTTAAAFILVAGLLTACGGGGGGGAPNPGTASNGGAPEVTAPKTLTVSSTLPLNGVVDMDPGKPIQVGFPTALDLSRLNGGQVQLSDDSRTLPITIAVNGSSMTITPVTPLKNRTDYRLTVKAGTSAADGSVLKSDYVLGLRTMVATYDLKTITAPELVFVDAGTPHIRMVELNGDGRLDMVEMKIGYRSGSNSGYIFNTYLQNPDKSFTRFQQLEFAYDPGPYAMSVNSLVVLDIDDDKKPELLVSEFRLGDEVSGIRVFKAGADGSYAPHAFIATPFSEMLQAADVDGDGKMDLIGTQRQSHNEFVSGFQVFLRTATGFSPLPPVKFAPGVVLRDVGVTDFDADGKRDIIVFRWTEWDSALESPGAEMLIHSRGENGSFSLHPGLTNEMRNFCAGAGFCEDMKIVDWNGDGKPLLIFNARTTMVPKQNQVLGFSRKEGGGLTKRFEFRLGAGKVLAAQDMDGDGVADLVVVGPDPVAQSEFFAIVGGRRDFSLEFSNIMHLDIAETMYPSTIAIGDLDPDGKPDIVFHSKYKGLVMARSIRY